MDVVLVTMPSALNEGELTLEVDGFGIIGCTHLLTTDDLDAFTHANSAGACSLLLKSCG
jgi:hypothetical protein